MFDKIVKYDKMGAKVPRGVSGHREVGVDEVM